MKLRDAVTQYVAHKQSMGMRFATEERTLKSFCRIEADRDLAQITPERVLAFLVGNGPPTLFWHRKHEARSGFYRFAIAHGYAGVRHCRRAYQQFRTVSCRTFCLMLN